MIPNFPPFRKQRIVYCNPGGVSESVLRASGGLLQQSGSLDVKFADTESEGVRTASMQLGEFKVKAVAITGLTAAVPFFDAIKAGKNEIAFLELLACPMGCVSGGGQPKVLLPQEKTAVYANRAGGHSVVAKNRKGSRSILPYSEFIRSALRRLLG